MIKIMIIPTQLTLFSLLPKWHTSLVFYIFDKTWLKYSTSSMDPIKEFDWFV